MKLPLQPSQLRRTDYLFLYFIAGLLVLVALFGVSMTLVLLFGDPPLALRMVTTFASLFTGVLGLGSGYLLGSRPTEQDEPRDYSHDRGT